MATITGKLRKRIGRLYQLIDAVPEATSRRRSGELIASLATFSADMRDFIPAIKDILETLLDDDAYRQTPEPDALLDELEAWVKEREAVEWGVATNNARSGAAGGG